MWISKPGEIIEFSEHRALDGVKEEWLQGLDFFRVHIGSGFGDAWWPAFSSNRFVTFNIFLINVHYYYYSLIDKFGRRQTKIKLCSLIIKQHSFWHLGYLESCGKCCVQMDPWLFHHPPTLTPTPIRFGFWCFFFLQKSIPRHQHQLSCKLVLFVGTYINMFFFGHDFCCKRALRWCLFYIEKVFMKMPLLFQFLPGLGSIMHMLILTCPKPDCCSTCFASTLTEFLSNFQW